ncbi:uncharacterized protein LOC118277165 isoform X3 [Spodoptera frugiperda]|nr:uncharacterized protein LOC118277165 isoform X3 [Spodoptera frugiperda]
MKTFIIIALLSALAACCSASVLPSEKEMAEGITVVENADEAELQKFLSTHPGHPLEETVFESHFSVPAIPGKVVTHRIEYIGGPDTVMTRTFRSMFPPLPAEVTTEGWLTNRLVMTLTSEVGGSLVGNVQFFGYKHFSK